MNDVCPYFQLYDPLPPPLSSFLLSKFWRLLPPLPPPFEETSFMNSPLEKALQRLLHGAMSSKIFRDWARFVYSSFTFSELKKNYKQVWNCCCAKLWIRIRFQRGFNHIMFSFTQAQPHSRMEHYFFSYLLTCKVDLFENSAIVAIKSDIVTFIHVKSLKVTSGFNLRRMKKIRQRALTCKKIKNKS